MNTIENPNLFRLAVLLEMVGLGIETATLMGGAGGSLGPAVGLAMILLGMVMYTVSVASLFQGNAATIGSEHV